MKSREERPARNRPSGRPQIVGIVNITEDSFSDGGRYLESEEALRHARSLVGTGADIVELGPASSHPDATLVSPQEQIERLVPVLDGLSRDASDADSADAGPSARAVPISIDATDPDVLRYAMGAGVAMLNDIRGFGDASLHPELAESRASLVVVHSLLERQRAERNAATPEEVLDSIDRFFENRLGELVQAGVSEDRLIVDPGMGFFLGNDPRSSIAVLQRIPTLRARFGRPVLISVSRKSFLRAITGRGVEEIGPATLAAELFAASEGVDYVRTHDAAALRDALEVARALGNDGS